MDFGGPLYAGHLHRRPRAGVAAQPGPWPAPSRPAGCGCGSGSTTHRRSPGCRGSCSTTPRATTSWPSRSAPRSSASSTCRRYLGRSRSTGRCACSRSSPRRSTSRSSTSRPSGGGSARPWRRASHAGLVVIDRLPSATIGELGRLAAPAPDPRHPLRRARRLRRPAARGRHLLPGRARPQLTGDLLDPRALSPRPRPAADGGAQRLPVRAHRRRRPVRRDGAGPGAAGRHRRGRDAVPDQRPGGGHLHRRVLRRAGRRAARRPGGQPAPARPCWPSSATSGRRPVLFLRSPDGNIFENVHAVAGRRTRGTCAR